MQSNNEPVKEKKKEKEPASEAGAEQGGATNVVSNSEPVQKETDKQ